MERFKPEIKKGFTEEYASYFMKFDTMFSDMLAHLLRFTSEVEHLGLINTKSRDKFSEIAELMKDYQDWKELTDSESQASQSDRLTDEIGDEVISSSNDTCKPVKNKIAKFTLPPNYDPDDSKWTLRYRETGPDLIELLPSSGVYVHAIKLQTCQRLARDCKSLARRLMMEIFSDSALNVCSLTGARATFFDFCETDIRPGLDANAKDTMMKYVEQYGRKEGWCTKETQCIINSLRNKLQDCRTKGKKKDLSNY